MFAGQNTICCSLTHQIQKKSGHPRDSEDLGERRGRDPPRQSLAGRPAARDVPGAMDSLNSCG